MLLPTSFRADAVENRAHRSIFVPTKMKFPIASATPEPLWGPTRSECAPLPSVARVSTLHGPSPLVLQNVQLSPLPAPAASSTFH